MKLFGDYHTHTVFSHGKGTVMENAVSARNKGLLEVGISDHGFSHPAFGLRRNKLSALRLECDSAAEETGIKVLMGVESNFVDSNGRCDLTEDDYSLFDLFLAGAHVFVAYKDFPSFWNLGLYSPLITKMGKQADEKLKAYTTNVYIKAIQSQPIDILTHIDFRVFSNVAEVADCCRQYGTYIEINTKKSHMSDEQWRQVSATGVNFVIGSDAHSPDRVADIDSAIGLIERIGIDKSRVHNLDRTPLFRFASFKGGCK